MKQVAATYEKQRDAACWKDKTLNAKFNGESETIEWQDDPAADEMDNGRKTTKDKTGRFFEGPFA